jgi:formylglycine-generating enzyme required for sulfatase activity
MKSFSPPRLPFFLALLLGFMVPGLLSAQEYQNPLGMRFIKIAPGDFFMGEDPGSFGPPDRDESPQHRVTFSKGFFIGKYEVTQAEWQYVMGWDPSFFPMDRHPVDSVSYNEIQVFISRLNQMEGGDYYRLPTEAEWEYVARAGSSGFYSYGSDPKHFGKVAWHYQNSSNSTHAVGSLIPNPWGLHDVHGNLWEWTQDWYAEDYYRESPFRDPSGPATGSARTLRGCGWDSDHWRCRVSYRNFMSPTDKNSQIGFRLYRSLSSARGK